jgi:CheY-like chemotaxis protein
MAAETSRGKALLVENEPLILMQVADLLKAEGFDVVEAWTATDAVTSLESEGPFRILFTDAHMPGPIDGFALASEVKARWPETAIIICSGVFLPHADELLQGVRFMTKPVTEELLSEALQDVLAVDGAES